MITSVAMALLGLFILSHRDFLRLRNYIGWYFFIIGIILLLRIMMFPQAPLAFSRLSYGILLIGSVAAFLCTLFPLLVLEPEILTIRRILITTSPIGGILICMGLSGSIPTLAMESLKEIPQLWIEGNRQIRTEILMRGISFILVQFYAYCFVANTIYLVRKYPQQKKWLYSYLIATIATMLFYDLWLAIGGPTYITLNRIAFIAICSLWAFYTPANTIEEKKLKNNTNELPNPLTPQHEKIRQQIEQTKPWLNPELTLPALANMLGTNRTTLSSLIRKMGYPNFNTFLNIYRTNEFKQKLKERIEALHNTQPAYPAEETEMKEIDLLTLGYEAGFKSKSTFYRSIHLYEGCSPNEYLRRLLQYYQNPE